jgi:hypothetical protein
VPLAPEKSWWLGLEDVHAGVLLLHGYGDRKLGQHKGIKAFAGDKDSMVWEQADLTFYGIAAEGVLAYESQAPESNFFILDIRGGEVLQDNITQAEAAMLVQHFARERFAACTYPVAYRDGEVYFSDVQEFITHQFSEEPVQALEYAELNNYIVVSYYLQGADSKLTNYLAVFDTAGNLLLKECLGTGLTGLGSDTFIIFNQILFFIQQKNILKVFKLC